MSQLSLVSWPCTVEVAMGTFFSHNEIIGLWIQMSDEEGQFLYHYRIYHGEAWRLPKHYQSTLLCNKFFGTIPEKITDADTINIEICGVDNNGNFVSTDQIEPIAIDYDGEGATVGESG